MKTDFKAHAISFVASLILAVAATLGVAVSMTTSGDHERTGPGTQSSSIAVAKSAAKSGGQVMSAWKAPVATTSRQVM